METESMPRQIWKAVFSDGVWISQDRGQSAQLLLVMAANNFGQFNLHKALGI